MLTIKNLTKSHAGRTLFRETEMTINWGERVALVGPNGAGKSTLFRMILGEDTPDEGSISMDEYAIVGYLPQEASEPKDETVLEIALGITPEMEQAITPSGRRKTPTKRIRRNTRKPLTPSTPPTVTSWSPKPRKFSKGWPFGKATSTAPPGKCPAAGSCARTWPSSLSWSRTS